MHIDMTEVAAVTAAARTGRVDAYATIHKALRAAMAEMLVQTGRLDCEDATAVQQHCDELHRFVDFCFGHIEHENRFIHPALEARAAGTSQRIAGEHVRHERDLIALRTRIDTLRAAPVELRPDAAYTLYHALGVFVAHNFVHMNIEESQHNPTLWQHYSDAELIAIQDRLVASLSPSEKAYSMRWMLRAMNPPERAAMLGAVKAGAPAEAFAALMRQAQTLLTDADWVSLARTLGDRLTSDGVYPTIVADATSARGKQS